MVAAHINPAPVSPDLSNLLWTRDLTREHGFERLTVEGALPTSLHGTLLRNGPGLFGSFGKRYSHPFEGDGALTAVRFDNGIAMGSSRVTPSRGLVEEREKGKPLYNSAAPWRRRAMSALRGKTKNTANTNVIVWQGRVLALMEADKPTELDARELTMIGETDLGAIQSAFSAHPHRVESRKALYNFGLQYGRKTFLHLYELPDVGNARHLGKLELSAATMLHDFIATDTHLVFFVSPVRMSIPRILLQVGSFEDWFQWKPEHGTEIICVPIDRPDEPIRFTTDAFYQWHFSNARNDGTKLVIDYCRYPTFDTFYEIGAMAHAGGTNALGEGRFHRATIDLDKRRMTDECLLDRSCEFPTVAPGFEGRANTISYLVLDDLGGLGRLNTKTGQLDAHVLDTSQRASEPLFVPNPNATAEDDGHVLSLCADGPSDRAFVAVYDAKRIAQGPVARVWFDHHVPITFHGTYAPTVAPVR